MKKAVKESWDAGVFMVFLIIDKQRGSESILDVRTPGNNPPRCNIPPPHSK